jgi:hypothetical protein
MSIYFVTDLDHNKGEFYMQLLNIADVGCLLFFILHCFFRAVYFLRISEEIRTFIALAKGSVGDWPPFFYTFFSMICGFSFVFRVLKVKFP